MSTEQKIEYRELNLVDFVKNDNSDNKGYIIEGKAISFNCPEVIWEDRFGNKYSEEIRSEAFENLDLSKLCLVYNHDSSKAKNLARIKNKTLEIELRNDGLYFKANLKTNLGKDVYQAIIDGELSKCSFGFIAKEEVFNSDTNLRSITKIDKIVDISIVDEPAYKNTFVSCRDCFSAKEEAIIKQKYNDERNKLLILLS